MILSSERYSILLQLTSFFTSKLHLLVESKMFMSRLYSEVLKKIIFPIADSIMRTNIIKYYQQIKNMSNWSKGTINEWQNTRLQKLISHAYNNTKYYKNLFDKIGMNPKSVRKKDLLDLPILTKNDIVENYSDLVPENIAQIHHKEASTGGSTGDPLRYLLDYRSWSFFHANTIFNWEKTRYRYGDKYVALGSTSLLVNQPKSPSQIIYYTLKNKVGLNGINMSEQVCEKYLQFIKKRKIKYVYGYASAIYLLASYALRNDISLELFACFPTSEVLTDLYRSTIRRAFNCDIVNFYGARDGGITAFEHEKNCFEVGYSSIVTVKEKDQNNIGSALLTDLFNFAIPLINYQLGDQVQLNDNNDYPYNGQIINHIFGRTSDVIRLENGHVLTGPGFTVLFKDLPVEAYSIEQVGSNSLICKIKRYDGYEEEHDNLINETIQKYAGEHINISIEYVNEFELTSSGKRRYFISG